MRFATGESAPLVPLRADSLQETGPRQRRKGIVEILALGLA